MASAHELFCKTTCNAPDVVAALLNKPPQGGTPCGEMCAALAAALAGVPEEQRAELKHEFIAITGAEQCSRLKGLRCPFYCELAAALVVKYHRRSTPGNKPKVMLIGDSICGLYETLVARELANEFEVVFPSENSRFAKYALNQLSSWFQECGEPDIIHWNVGLWDSAVVCDEEGMFTVPEEYVFYMSRIQRELEKHCKKVIFATTTPVRDGSLNQHIEYVDAINAAIVPWMHEHNVPVNDLYALVKPRIEELVGPDCIHLSAKGSELCAKAVADAIRAEMKKK